jgi:hypothetical protein
MTRALALLSAFLLSGCVFGGGHGGDGGGEPAPDGGASRDGGVTPIDGGIVTRDGGIAPIDGGIAPPDGGIAPIDGGAAGCSTNHDCSLGQVCSSPQCVSDPGGFGTACPNGDSDCVQDNKTGCTGQLTVTGPVCTRGCRLNSDCPNPWTCQTTTTSNGDGGSVTIQICLASGALGVACTNETATGATDPNWECTQQGYYCLPDTNTSATGHCRPGDNCNFASQTGCSNSTDTCHPTGAFDLDDNHGTVCEPSGSGSSGSPCQALSDCAKGYLCTTQLGCMKYCTPGGGSTQCVGITGQDGGAANCQDILVDSSGNPLPAAVRSIPVGLCL